jgi:peptide/nickel transport system permease protein
MAIAAPWLSPRDPIKTAARTALHPPGAMYWLGSDQLGRDVASRVLHGARISLTVGLIAVSIAVAIGTPIGLVSGFYGGRLDAFIMRVIDVLLAFPGILLALAIVSVLTPGLSNVMIAVGALGGAHLRAAGARERAIRAREPLRGGGARARQSRSVDPRPLHPAQRRRAAGGHRHARPRHRHPGRRRAQLPRLGSQPPQPEWGRMLSEGRDYLREAWWISTFPGLGIMLTVLGMNLLGDGLRDVLDPRLKV